MWHQDTSALPPKNPRYTLSPFFFSSHFNPPSPFLSLSLLKTMEASLGSKPFDSFKSKKILHSSSSQKPSPSEEITTKPVASNRSPWSAQTPEKPAGHPRRARNRRAAFSVKEVREEASKLNAPEQDRIRRSDPVGSSGQQIGSGSGKPKKKVDGPVKLPEK